VALTTFRANEGDITSDPSGRTDGDTTTWLYDEATGLELKKTYADGSCVSRTYDELNRQETLVKARGLVTTYKYAPFTGELISVSYSDGTSPWIFSSNHLGQIISVYDASGLREFSYDSYGRMIQDTSFGQVESSLQEEYDAQGRSNGYRLMLGTRTVQHSHLDYDSKGGMIGMNLEGLKSSFTWRYDQTTGFLHHLTYPNGMVRCNTYHPTLNLVTAIGYRKGADGELAAGHEYDYDALMRPTQRRDLWDAATPATIRDFTYNSRSELLEDRISRGGSFAYCYDNIGNRKTARELEKEVAYESNPLNQYTEIAGEGEDFTPVYDADGNQTRIRTSTGIWEISYDANDRPVVFTSQDGRTSITCGYDYRGRRFEKKVTVNGAVSSHSRFLYRDYLQVAELDLMQPEPMLIKSYLLDPTEPTATRILMMTCWQENGMKVKEHLYFMHDALKNVTSIFDGQQTRRARYEYAPFGSLLTAKEDMAQENKFRFSCEYADDELGLVYYNYRHLNPADGRWINRDPIQEQGGWNLY
uniref:RHS repeat domain-containing protein n=1 Tax=Akkermansia sp. TaxID=1872421 RepID=UPI003AAF95A9